MFYRETRFNKNQISEYKHIYKTKIHNLKKGLSEITNEFQAPLFKKVTIFSF